MESFAVLKTDKITHCVLGIILILKKFTTYSVSCLGIV